MTVTADTATTPSAETCPSWCTGHGQVDDDELVIHRGPLTETLFGRTDHPAYAHVQAFGCASTKDEVFVYGRHNDICAGVVTTSDWHSLPAEACKLADLIDVLSRATPAQHRKIAAAIRKAAAQITEAGQ